MSATAASLSTSRAVSPRASSLTKRRQKTFAANLGYPEFDFWTLGGGHKVLFQIA
jgi:hypothetical protein